MAKYLLITVAVAVLSASLLPLAHTRPLSWSRSTRYQRSLKTEPAATEAPTLSTEDAGRVQQSPMGVRPGAGNGGGADNATLDPLANCMEQCYNKRLPRTEIDRLKKIVFDGFLARGVHPGFLVSQWLENYHRVLFCRSRNFSVEPENVLCEADDPQTLNETVSRINDTVVAQLGYKVQYNPDWYPRYLVEVDCNSTAGTTAVLKNMKYLLYDESSRKWNVDIRATTIKCR